ncbi:DUF2861 family protein, partial [Vibrio sp.]|uniref:DUF2861 family protein n=1 Tax=Vibrio sp. TaxID=678 RepID=UPI003D0DF225
VKRFSLGSKLTRGLYRIDITAKDQTTWSSWLLLDDQKPQRTLRWASKDRWVIDKNALLNPYCPLPKLGVTVYDYVDGSYNEIWSQSYESDYPQNVDNDSVPPGRYVLGVSMTHQRWQGSIIVEQTQIISKTFDVSIEE